MSIKCSCNNKVIGIAIIVLSLLFLYRSLEILHDYYKYPNLFRIFLIPKWILFFECVGSIFTTIIGQKCYIGRWKSRSAILYSIIIWVITFGLEILQGYF